MSFSSSDINIPAIIETSKELGELKANKREIRPVNGVECIVDMRTGSCSPLRLTDSFLDHPRRKRATVDLYETKSFIEYVNRHKVANRTHIFGKATELGGSFTAVLDYHDEERSAPGEGAEATKPLANFGQHTCELTLQTTPEWRRWVQSNAKLISQEQFAEFIEDNMNDIVEPAAADILEMAQLLQGKKTVTFRGGRNLRTGAIALEFVENIEVQGTTNRQDGQMQLPDRFKLGLVPFIGADGVEIEARLRFRIGSDGKLSFAYVLNRPYKLIEEAFGVAMANIEQGIGLPVMLGSASIHTT